MHFETQGKTRCECFPFAKLFSRSHHPQEEDDDDFDEGDLKMVLKSELYIEKVRCHLARALFGEEAINEGTDTVKEKYLTPLNVLYTRTWDTKKVQLATSIKKRGRLPELFNEALQGTFCVSLNALLI
jgi:hypothetical protein